MTPADPDPAKARFFIIAAVRLSGVALVFLGMAVLAGKLPLPRIAGYAIAGIGMFDAFVLPLFLTKRWKTPRP